MNSLILDLETGCKEVHGRKGHFKYNDIIAIGLKYNDYGLDERDAGRLTGGPHGIYGNTLIQTYLNKVDILVGHNIKYDLLYLWQSQYLQYWLKNGGQIWDTQLVHYMLTAQQETYPALRDIAVRCYGCKQRDKLMESYWAKGIDTKDIPGELVLEDVINDVMDTEVIFFKQIVLAKEKGMLTLIQLEMDALLATTEIEYNGMTVDKTIMSKNKTELELELIDKLSTFHNLIKDYWIEK